MAREYAVDMRPLLEASDDGATESKEADSQALLCLNDLELPAPAARFLFDSLHEKDRRALKRACPDNDSLLKASSEYKTYELTYLARLESLNAAMHRFESGAESFRFSQYLYSRQFYRKLSSCAVFTVMVTVAVSLGIYALRQSYVAGSDSVACLDAVAAERNSTIDFYQVCKEAPGGRLMINGRNACEYDAAVNPTACKVVCDLMHAVSKACPSSMSYIGYGVLGAVFLTAMACLFNCFCFTSIENKQLSHFFRCDKTGADKTRLISLSERAVPPHPMFRQMHELLFGSSLFKDIRQYANTGWVFHEMKIRIRYILDVMSPNTWRRVDMKGCRDGLKQDFAREHPERAAQNAAAAARRTAAGT